MNTWTTAHSDCDHFSGQCYHADPNYVPTPHTANCKCDVCGHCDECQDGTAGPIGSYCLTCHRTQRPDSNGKPPKHVSHITFDETGSTDTAFECDVCDASVPDWMTVQRTAGENALLSGAYRWQATEAVCKCQADYAANDHGHPHTDCVEGFCPCRPRPQTQPAPEASVRSAFPNHRSDCESTVSRYVQPCDFCVHTDLVEHDIPAFIAAVRELGEHGQVRFRPTMGGTFVIYRYDHDSPTGVMAWGPTLPMNRETTAALDAAGIRQAASRTL